MKIYIMRTQLKEENMSKMEKRMEKRRKEYQQDKIVYGAIETLIKIGVIIWIASSIILTVISEFLEK